MKETFAKKRVWILIAFLMITIIATFSFDSYFCAALSGALSTLLLFQTIGKVLYRKALQRMTEQDNLKRTWDEPHNSD